MSEQTDIIIGCVTDYEFDAMRPWVNSLEQSGFCGRKAMIVYNASPAAVRELETRDFIIYGPGKRDSRGGYFYRDNFHEDIVVIRFFHIWQLLRSLNHLNLRFCITTDVRDLIFQTNPSDYLGDHLGTNALNVGSESLIYANEPWGNRNMYNSFGPSIYDFMSSMPIYNAGAIGGRAHTLADFCLNIYLLSKGSPNPTPIKPR